MKHNSTIGTQRQALRSLPRTVTLPVLLLLMLVCISTTVHAQAVDGTGGTAFAHFKTNVLPILNGLVGIACLFGIGKGALDLIGGHEHGKRNIVWVVIGGMIWALASTIITTIAS